MPNFGMAPNSANGQNGPNGQDPASVYNGLAQGYPSRESPDEFLTFISIAVSYPSSNRQFKRRNWVGNHLLSR